MTYMEVENHDDFYSFEASNQIRVWDQQGVGVVYDSALEDLSNLETELLTVGSYYLSKGPQHAQRWVWSGWVWGVCEECVCVRSGWVWGVCEECVCVRSGWVWGVCEEWVCVECV